MNIKKLLMFAVGVVILIFALFALKAETALAGSNGQQLSVTVRCSSRLNPSIVQLTGKNQYGQVVTHTMSKAKNSFCNLPLMAANTFSFKNVWWNGDVNVNVSYHDGGSAACVVNVPKYQVSNWVDTWCPK